MSKIILILSGLSILIIFWVYNFVTAQPPSTSTTQSSLSSITAQAGDQVITIAAKGGYSPKQSIAKAGVPTKLKIQTKGTYDCSTSLIIKSLNFQKLLPATGEVIVDAGVPAAGSSIVGICGMGMYSFVVNFN